MPASSSTRSTTLVHEDTVFAALADGSRRLLLDRLRDGDASLTQLRVGLAMTRQAVAKHLAVLRGAGLVSVRSEGRQRIHSLRPAPLRDVDAWLSAYSGLWDEALGRLADHIRDNP